jgi:hypothetical protein
MIDAIPTAMSRGGPALVLLSLAMALTGCAHQPKATPSWQTVISRKDIQHLRDWRTAWVNALAKARSDGNGAAIAAEGSLLDPDAGLDAPTPPAGDYTCREIRFGDGGGVINGFKISPAARCRIHPLGDEVLGFATLDGVQRPIGRIYPGPSARLTFLGSLTLGDETRPFDYGIDTERDLAGFAERIGPSHWRLALPHPPFGGAFEVIDLLPRTE